MPAQGRNTGQYWSTMTELPQVSYNVIICRYCAVILSVQPELGQESRNWASFGIPQQYLYASTATICQ